MEIKLKLKRHESFSIREGWLAKGIKNVKEYGNVFALQNTTDILGIGTNMVKSLKYWMTATTLINDNSKLVSTFLFAISKTTFLRDSLFLYFCSSSYVFKMLSIFSLLRQE